MEREDRTQLVAATGDESVPALVAGPAVVIGEAAIAAYLGEHYLEPAEAEGHRLKAAKARRRYLEEECECSERITR
jgi:hypothetical protein